MTYENNPRRHTLSAHDKLDRDKQQKIEDAIQSDLVERPTSKQSQHYLMQAWNNQQWIGCSCAENAYLSIRKTSNYYVLVRLTSQGQHANDCPFSEANMPIYRKKLAEKLNVTTLSFHKARPKKSNTTYNKSPISINGLQAESSKLARFMFSLYDDAGLNHIPLDGTKPDLRTQYLRIRQAAAKYNVAGQSGNNVIFTHPGSVPKAIDFLKEKQWPSGTIPQVLLFLTVDQIDGRNMLMNIGKKSYELTCQSKVETFYDEISSPSNVLMTLAQRPDSPAPEVLKAAAVPILEKSWLLPVKNNLVRKFIKSMLAMSKDYEVYDSRIVTPFFSTMFENINVRPDFSIERAGNTLAVFYFITEKDENYAVRKGEIDFLSSHGIIVKVFDMDKVRDDPLKDAWREADSFFKKYIKHFKLEAKAVPEKSLDDPDDEDEDKPINLLAQY